MKSAEFSKQFETLKQEAMAQSIIQADFAFSKKLQKYYTYTPKQCEEKGLPIGSQKPMRSVHNIDFGDGHVLRISRSKRERRKQLTVLFDIVRNLELNEVQTMLNAMKGLELGANIFWNTDDTEVVTFASFAAYFESLEVAKVDALLMEMA